MKQQPERVPIIDLNSIRHIQPANLNPFNRQYSRAFTMIEMALMLLIAGLLFSTVAPVYVRVIEEKKSDQTADSVELIADKIDDFYKTHGYYPDSLSEIYDPVPLDPWGNPYEYVKIEGAGTNNPANNNNTNSNSSSSSNNSNSNANNTSSNTNSSKGNGKGNSNSSSASGNSSSSSNSSASANNNGNGNGATLNTNVGKLRKDKNLVPINSDYDLYSKGPDGQSSSPLTASISQDDIVRGRNGTFFGKASEY